MITLIVNFPDHNGIGQIQEDMKFDHLPRVGDTVIRSNGTWTVSDVTFNEEPAGHFSVNNITLLPKK